MGIIATISLLAGVADYFFGDIALKTGISKGNTVTKLDS